MTGNRFDAIAATYARLSARRALVLAVAGLCILVSFLLDVATGPAFLPVREVARSVLALSQDRTVDAIVWTIPRCLVDNSAAPPRSCSPGLARPPGPPHPSHPA